MKAKSKQLKAARRANRTRICMHGTQARPRLSVNRSAKHIYAQVINDDKGITLVSASDRDVKATGKPVEIAREVGKILAAKAKAAGVDAIVFDRGSYRYHGRVASFADGAREGGLNF